MILIKNYYTLLSELRLAERKLKCKKEQKQLYLNKITSCTSSLKEVVVTGGVPTDKMTEYSIKCEELDEEISLLEQDIKLIKEALKEMDNIIKNISGIEEKIFRLYYIENKTPTQISYIVPCDKSTVYRHLKKIKTKYNKKK